MSDGEPARATAAAPRPTTTLDDGTVTKRRVKQTARKSSFTAASTTTTTTIGAILDHDRRSFHRISASAPAASASSPAPAQSRDGGATAATSDRGASSSSSLPPTHAADRVAKSAQLEKFRTIEARVKREGTAKPDMVAYSRVSQGYPPACTPRWGHVPGCDVGEIFVGRGEVAAVGLHIRMMQGIDFNADSVREGGGAYAICLAGGYKDDDDKGLDIWYTGQGGQDKRKQVKSQVLTKGNLALARNKESGKPVRVIRKGAVTPGRVEYIYEGEYAVAEYKFVESEDGPFIYKFLLRAIPGRSKAPAPPTEFLGNFIRYAGDFTTGTRGRRNRTLDDRGRRLDGGKRAWTALVRRTNEELRVSEMERRAVCASQWKKDAGAGEAPGEVSKGTLVMMDVAAGRERVIVPAFNEVDDATDVVPEGFRYVRNCSEKISAEAAAALASTTNPPEPPRPEATATTRAYNEEFCLCESSPDGVVEPPPTADEATKSADPKSRFLGESIGACVRLGLWPPLEVFRTTDKDGGCGVARRFPPARSCANTRGRCSRNPKPPRGA